MSLFSKIKNILAYWLFFLDNLISISLSIHSNYSFSDHLFLSHCLFLQMKNIVFKMLSEDPNHFNTFPMTFMCIVLDTALSTTDHWIITISFHTSGMKIMISWNTHLRLSFTHIYNDIHYPDSILLRHHFIIKNSHQFPDMKVFLEDSP
jgi:hypothetical protein